MPKKRSSTRIHEKTTNDGTFQQKDDAKRTKLTSFSDTTLQDLPIEMLECILVKAIAMEVKDMKFTKSVWNEKADLVIDRLRTVCSHWSNILTTHSFRTGLHRTLDGLVQETIRFEVSHQSLIKPSVVEIAMLKDEIFLYCQNVKEDRSSSFDIEVYDLSDLTKVKNVIQMDKIHVRHLEGCNLSNCVYVSAENKKIYRSSVVRIARDKRHQLRVHKLIDDTIRCVSSMTVSVNGSILIASRSEWLYCNVVRTYDPDGILQQNIHLSRDTFGYRDIKSVIQKSNGNLVLASADNEEFELKLTEITHDGTIIREYQSSHSGWSRVSIADPFGRIVLYEGGNELELLDSDLNLLDVSGPESCQFDSVIKTFLHYNSKRNEIVGFLTVNNVNILSFLRFREE